MGETLRRGIPDADVTVLVGSELQNVVRVGIGEADMGAAGLSVTFNAMKGIPPFEQRYALQALTPRAWDPFTFLVMSEIDITSIKDLVEKEYPLKTVTKNKR